MMKHAALILVALSAVSACRRDADRSTEQARERNEAERNEARTNTQGTDTQAAHERTTPGTPGAYQGDTTEPGMTPASRVERKAEADFEAAKGFKLDGDA